MSPAASIGRLWRTVRWLKAEQVAGRLARLLPRPRPDLRPAPPRRDRQGPWVRPAARAPSLVGPRRFSLLGETHDLDSVGWDDPKLALLWRYNLHYFDDLNAAGAAERSDWHRHLVERWCRENAIGQGTAWAPYPTSLRIVNWIKWWLSGAEPTPAWLDSLAWQARWLARRLERHLLGNHLFANAKALMFAGLVFDGSEAEAWLARGRQLVQRELDEQILADGGQFERSPMYHALALEDVLDLLNVIGALAPADAPVRRLQPTLRRLATPMRRWLHAMTLPDGTPARFNDAAPGIAPDAAELARVADALGIDDSPLPDGDDVFTLQPSGYVRVRCGRATAWLDLAPIGPDYLPGHAHADTLAFELALDGRMLIVNRGTSVYGDGPRRQLERGTGAHSTVQLGDHDSSEVWAGFRVGRRARPGPVRIRGFEVAGSHDGYRHLGPAHHRVWRFSADGLQVDDELDPAPGLPAVARYHLAPGLHLRPPPTGTPGIWCIDAQGRTVAQADVGAAEARIEDWEHALGFGRRVPAQTLCVGLRDGRAHVRWLWRN